MFKRIHAFPSAKADGADATKVRPSNWNAEHRIGNELTNRTGGQIVSGDVVGVDEGNNESVKLRDTLSSQAPFVVAMETIANLAAGLFAAAGMAWTIQCAGAVTRGNWLVKSATTKAVEDAGLASASTPAPLGALGVALTNSVGAGTVVCLLGGTGGGGGDSKGADLASASSLDIGQANNYFHVTGITGITGITSRVAGIKIALEFDGALTLTHNTISLILQGGVNYLTAAGEVLFFVSEGSGNWRQVAQDHQHLAYLSAGGNAGTVGAIRLANEAQIVARNAANTGNLQMFRMDSSNRLLTGDDASSQFVPLGAVRCDINAGSRLVVPVGVDKWAT